MFKEPIAVERFCCSDGKEFNSREDARCHEVFLAVLPVISSRVPGTLNAYAAITALASQFDFVPR